MTTSIIRDKGKNSVQGCLVLCFWLAVWQVIYLAVGQDILVASPAQVLNRIVVLGTNSSFWGAIGVSCIRILAGFFLALLAGGLLAVAACRIPGMLRLISPLLTVIKATPVTSFILLALIWFTTNKLPVFTTYLMVLPLVFGNLFEGIRAVDPLLLEMADIFRLPPGKRLMKLYAPSLRPYFLAACSTGLGFAWKAGIAAEIIARPSRAIGSEIYQAKIHLETADVFAWTAVLILLSLLIEKGLIGLLKSLLAAPREEAVSDGN